MLRACPVGVGDVELVLDGARGDYVSCDVAIWFHERRWNRDEVGAIAGALPGELREFDIETDQHPYRDASELDQDGLGSPQERGFFPLAVEGAFSIFGEDRSVVANQQRDVVESAVPDLVVPDQDGR